MKKNTVINEKTALATATITAENGEELVMSFPIGSDAWFRLQELVTAIQKDEEAAGKKPSTRKKTEKEEARMARRYIDFSKYLGYCFGMSEEGVPNRDRLHEWAFEQGETVETRFLISLLSAGSSEDSAEEVTSKTPKE